MPGWVAPGALGKTMSLQFNEYADAFAKENVKLDNVVKGITVGEGIQIYGESTDSLLKALKKNNIEKVAEETKKQKTKLTDMLQTDYDKIFAWTEDNKLTHEK